jgi:hypothetical protein
MLPLLRSIFAELRATASALHKPLGIGCFAHIL